MKKMKKLASILLAAIMVLAMAVPTFATSTITPADGSEHTITIKDTTGHVFKAYQIFVGDAAFDDGNTILSNIKFGKGITTEGKAALYGKYLSGQSIDATAYDDPHNVYALAEAIEAENDGAALANILAETRYLDSTTAIALTAETDGTTYVSEEVANGYYMVVDETEGNSMDNNDAYSSYIIKVVGDNVTATPKKEVPSVDKQVQDESEDSENSALDGWGETADHEINESFKFRLIATIPNDSEGNFDYYETYKLIFTDKMDTGVTFEQIDSVTITFKDTTPEKSLTDVQYAVSGVEKDDAGKEWTLTIENLLDYLGGAKLGQVDKITVVYSAHLNENAIVVTPTKEGSYGINDANKNKVNLQYSNNPNVNGSGDLGKTPDDTVFVFSYKLPNTKYADQIGVDHELKGAGFTLEDKDGKAIKLIKNADGSYTVADQKITADVKDGEAAKTAASGSVVTEMFSDTSGKFDVKGLDDGTYILRETTTPPGYNTCDLITVVVKATHKENNDADVTDEVRMSLTQNGSTEENATENNVVNKSGATLPETGGIGTTIFYVLGSILVLGAVILLVTKRRMNVEK